MSNYGLPANVNFDPSNPDPRVACVLVLDTSGSMQGEPIDQLNQGLQQFIQEVQSDSIAASRVELAIVTFGPVDTIQTFAPITSINVPTLDASGDTPLGAALQQAIDLVKFRKDVYKSAGVPYYRPWIFLITDGAPNTDDAWQEAAQRIKDEEAKKGLSLFAVGVTGADMAILNQLGSRPAASLKGYSFREMFQWLSSSLSSVSASNPNDQVALQPPTWTSA
jgi:uncharacterized protein YegL